MKTPSLVLLFLLLIIGFFLLEFRWPKIAKFTIVKEQLHEMQQDERRKECIQMDIKRIAPFNVCIDLAATQIFIGK